MKRIALTILIPLLLASCSKSDNADRTCNFLLDVGVALPINLNLPQYSQLQFPSSPIYIAGQGNKGIIVMNTGTSFVAWDASDPNHSPNTCSTLQIDGALAVCGCEDNEYIILTGQPNNDGTLRCGLKPYRVEASGNELFISN